MRRSLAFDILVAAGVAVLTIPGLFQTGLPGLTLAIGLAMATALLWRRRLPLTVMGAISSLALLQVLTLPGGPATPLPFDIAVLIAMYSVVKYGRRLSHGFLAGGVTAIGAAIAVAQSAVTTNWWTLALTYAGICGSVWLTAYTMRNRRKYVESLEERAETLEREREHLARIAVAEERADIARELHDVVAHSLAVMVVQADGGRYALDSDPGKSREALEVIAGTGREALRDMKKLVGVLRAERTIPELPDLVSKARNAGLTVQDDIGQVGDLPAAVRLTVSRIVQEGLTNVLRHAGSGTTVTLSVRREDGNVKLSVVDDGLGASGVPIKDGHGLIGMRERIAVHGGTLRAGPRFAGGWSVEAEIPA
ncbi:MAG TPA: sensor histidine kinase [Candidatus Limnocylindrales bacterium]